MTTYILLAISFSIAFNIITITRVLKEWQSRGYDYPLLYRPISFLITVVLFPIILIVILFAYDSFVEAVIEGGIDVS